MIATLSDLQIASAELEKYVDMRRMHINRALAEQPGFEGSVLLRARERKAAGEENLALFNFWDSAADADAWKVAPRHDEVAEYVIPLVKSITTNSYERIEDASVTAAPASAARVARISIQDIKPARVNEYLAYRRDVIHPSMESADGFVSAWVLRDVERAARFAIFFRWRDDDAAETYFHDPYHLGEITDRVRELLAGSLSTERYDILPVGAG